MHKNPTVSFSRPSLCFNKELHSLKVAGRLERQYKRSVLTIQMFQQHQQDFINALNCQYSNRINNGRGITRVLFSTENRLFSPSNSVAIFSAFMCHLFFKQT